VDPFKRREGARPYSPMMADDSGAWTEIGVEKGSPLAGAGEAES
jgi:hypothetical protein